jgi:type II secretory pathway predicted ATPase ExeA
VTTGNNGLPRPIRKTAARFKWRVTASSVYKSYMDVPVFTVSPDPTCMYQTPSLKDSVAKIRRAITLKQGLSCIFGSVGFGKSSLLRYIASGYDHSPACRVALIAEQTNGPQFAFLKAISKEFDIPPQRSASAQMDAIEAFLTEQHTDNKTVIVMVDEAQLLRLETLECIRSLLNYETNTEKLCQVILAGQLELRDRLQTKRYKAFKSRIVAPVVLEYFSSDETKAMIEYRHDYWQVPNRFGSDVCERVHEKSLGVPRDIVLICGYAYSMADQRKLNAISPSLVDEAASQLDMYKEREVAVA